MVIKVNVAGQIISAQKKRLGLLLVPGKMSLSGLLEPVPEALIAAPTDLRAVDAFVGEEIARGRFSLAGRTLETGGRSPFTFEPPSAAFFDRLHGFGWLRHIRATQTSNIYDVARRLVIDWMQRYGRKVKSAVWAPELAAQRLMAWLSHSPILLQDADSNFYGRFLKSISRHIRYLRAVRNHTKDGEPRLRVFIALALASLSTPTDPKRISRYGMLLDNELSRQIYADGGHISRNPRVLIELLLDLLPLRHSYINLGFEAPSGLAQAIDRLYHAIRFFRHGDGNLALFNGAMQPLANEMVSVLRYDESSGNASKELIDSGFHRMSAGDTAVIMDTGLAKNAEVTNSTAAGCLSFEMSVGTNRFIVNSGFPHLAKSEYQKASRLTAAHSTLTLNDTSSARPLSERWIGPNLIGGLSEVDVSRDVTSDGAHHLTASHDGYVSNLGYYHRREIELSADGMLFSGKDSVIPSKANSRMTLGVVRASVRFHIHPSIHIYHLDESSVYLCAMDGTTLLFTALDHPLIVSEDIYMGEASGIRPSHQLEISCSGLGPFDIAWMIRRTQ